tara:strand:+ start:366 stop:593 length:228 start_codon:yes stop_codon:yes gene_type:complete
VEVCKKSLLILKKLSLNTFVKGGDEVYEVFDGRNNKVKTREDIAFRELSLKHDGFAQYNSLVEDNIANDCLVSRH